MRERLLAAERVKAIEWRDGTLRLLDQRLLPQEEVWLEHESAAEVDAYNPVFDVTPADLIDAIVTERGVVERPDAERMAALMSRKRLH